MMSSSAPGFCALLLLVLAANEVSHACPDGCACFVTSQVICNLASLKEIPSDIPTSTKYLTLNENHIRAIPTDALKDYDQLKSLRLDDNNITEIGEYAFRGLADMDEIALQKNPLEHLPSYSFAGLRNVQRIYLGYNKIRSIAANAFYGSQNIREIYLIKNPITVMHSNAFTGFSNVQFFYFPKGIRRIEPDAFNGLKNVSMLRLESMNMTALEQFSFRGLLNVAGLEIRNSHVKTMETGAFSGLAHVNYFGLEDNTFDGIEAGAFNGMKNIDTLIIGKNSILDIEENGLVGLEASRVKRFNFTSNRIPCNCVLHRLVRGLEKLAPAFLDNNFCQSSDNGEKASSVVNIAEVEGCPTAAPPVKNVDVEVSSRGNVDVSTTTEVKMPMENAVMDLDVANPLTSGADVIQSLVILYVVSLNYLLF